MGCQHELQKRKLKAGGYRSKIYGEIPTSKSLENVQSTNENNNYEQIPYPLRHQTPLQIIINFTIFLLSFDLLEEIIRLESPRSLPSTTELVSFIILQILLYQTICILINFLSHYFNAPIRIHATTTGQFYYYPNIQ